MSAFWSLRVVELLLVAAPEVNGVQRILVVGAIPPLDPNKVSSKASSLSPPPETNLTQPPPRPPSSAPLSTAILEPIPAPYTLEKLYWAASLWGNYRGIGWTYQSPLSRHALDPPFLRTSSPRAFLINRTKQLVFALSVTDVLSTLLTLEPSRAYFSAIEGVSPRLADQAVHWRALFSVMVVSFVWSSMEVSYVATAISCVSFGSMLGWEGALWEPWGWPPLFGSLSELWRRPGLAMMWSRTWHS